MTDKVLLGMGNPLLDISANCDQAFLDKYGFQMGNAVLAEEKHQGVYTDMCENLTVEYIAGGATQNSIRVAQWILKDAPKSTVFVGCVGKDTYAETLKKSAESDGVDVQYLIDADTPTGTCAVLVKDKERSLCANLAAANNYKIDHIQTDAIAEATYKKATHVYSAGFFLTVSPETVNFVSEHCAKEGKVFMMNLSAPFIVDFFTDKLLKGLENTDFLFGNESEALAFGKKHEITDLSIANIAKEIQKVVKGGKGTVVITQGAEPTIVASEGKCEEFPTPELAGDKIVDSNGAGDSFVGGFAAGLMAGKDIPTCVALGQTAAGQVLGVSGCDLVATGAFKGTL